MPIYRKSNSPNNDTQPVHESEITRHEETSGEPDTSPAVTEDPTAPVTKETTAEETESDVFDIEGLTVVNDVLQYFSEIYQFGGSVRDDNGNLIDWRKWGDKPVDPSWVLQQNENTFRIGKPYAIHLREENRMTHEKAPDGFNNIYCTNSYMYCHFLTDSGEVVFPNDQPTMTFHIDEKEVVYSLIFQIITEYSMETKKNSYENSCFCLQCIILTTGSLIRRNLETLECYNASKQPPHGVRAAEFFQQGEIL